MESSPLSFADLVSTQAMIFSCGICQRTFNEIYPDDVQTSTVGSRQFGSRLWMTDCSHVTCRAHFHPNDSHPKAPCPVCVATEGDNSRKRLFAINGLSFNEHDPVIPKEHFEAVISKIDESDAVGASIRFQYMALARFGAMMHKRLQLSKGSVNTINKEKFNLAEELRSKEQENMLLKEDIEELKVVEDKHKRWKSRQPEVTAYLNSYAALVRENTSLKTQLSDLGYEVPDSNWKSLGSDNAADLLRSDSVNLEPTVTKSQSSRVFVTPMQSETGTANPFLQNTPPSVPVQSISRKRPREVDEGYHGRPPTKLNRPNKTVNEMLMPPPPLPSHARQNSNESQDLSKTAQRKQRTIPTTARSNSVDLPPPRFSLNQQKSNIFVKAVARVPGITVDNEDANPSINFNSVGHFQSQHEINAVQSPSFERSKRSEPRPVEQREVFNSTGSSTANILDQQSNRLNNSWFYGNRQESNQYTQPTNYRDPQAIENPNQSLPSFSRPSSQIQHASTFHPIPIPGPAYSSRLENASSTLRPRRAEHLANNSLNTLSFLNSPYDSTGSKIHGENDTSSSQSNSSGPFPQNLRAKSSFFQLQDTRARTSSVGLNNRSYYFKRSHIPQAQTGLGVRSRLRLSKSPDRQVIRGLPLSGASTSRELFQRYAYDFERIRAGSIPLPGTSRANSSNTNLGPLRQGMRSSRGLLNTSSGVYRNRRKLIR